MNNGTKIIALIGIGLLLFGVLAFAWEEGDIVLRTTFSQQDFSNQNLDCRHEGTEINLDKKPLTIDVMVSCLSAKIIDDENVMITRQWKGYSIRILGTSDQEEGELYTLKECVQQGYTPKECWNNYFKPEIIKQVKAERNRIRVYLNDLRDPTLPVGIDPNDFGLTDEEVND